MDKEKLLPLLEAVKKNPKDPWAWMQLGYIAKLTGDLDTAYRAYLASVRIDPDSQESIEKFSETREQFLQSLEIDENLILRIYPLPFRTAVVMLAGIINTDVAELKTKVQNAATKNIKYIILDFTGVSHITGLGPSCLRNLNTFVNQHDGKMALVKQSEEVKRMLSLKRIEIAEYQDIAEAFLDCR